MGINSMVKEHRTVIVDSVAGVKNDPAGAGITKVL